MSKTKQSAEQVPLKQLYRFRLQTVLLENAYESEGKQLIEDFENITKDY